MYSLDSSAHFTWSSLFATKRTIWLSFQCKKHIVVVRVRYVPSRWGAYCVGVLWVTHNIPYLFTITLLCLGCFLVYDTCFRDCLIRFSQTNQKINHRKIIKKYTFDKNYCRVLYMWLHVIILHRSLIFFTRECRNCEKICNPS